MITGETINFDNHGFNHTPSFFHLLDISLLQWILYNNMISIHQQSIHLSQQNQNESMKDTAVSSLTMREDVGCFNSSIDNYRKYFANQQRQYYPLWQPVNFRVEEGGIMVGTLTNSSIPTGFHFHNFMILRSCSFQVPNLGIFSRTAVWCGMCQVSKDEGW
jgi:hypothetical protein